MPRKLKKDFDRDKMYSKIMPTSIPEPQPDQLEEQAFVPLRPRPDDSVFELELSVPKPDDSALELELSAPRLHNFMEDMLREKLPHTMKVLRSCPCERCQLDILAIALNSLPSYYAVTAKDDGSQRVKNLRREYEVKVTATLIKAIQQVKNSPRHSKSLPPLT